MSESVAQVLGRNLVVARVLAGVTQQELAEVACVSRATVVQLETGSADPKLSTVVDVARALGVSTIALLAGVAEVNALAALLGGAVIEVPPTDAARMGEFARSGLLKDRIRAGRVGASVARRDGETAALTAGIFSASVPGAGTVVGAVIGKSLGQGGAR